MYYKFDKQNHYFGEKNFNNLQTLLWYKSIHYKNQLQTFVQVYNLGRKLEYNNRQWKMMSLK